MVLPSRTPALAPSCLLVLLAPVLAEAGEVRVTVEHGRALFVSDAGVTPVTRGKGCLVHDTGGQLELAPGSRARVSWVGTGTVSLLGPASLGWHGNADGQDLRLDLVAARSAELEVRRGPVRTRLPGAWTLALEKGAYSLEQLPTGGVELGHLAGRTARATWMGGEGFAPPPLEVLAGQRVRLDGAPPLTARPDVSRGAPGWSTTAWPWGEATEGAPAPGAPAQGEPVIELALGAELSPETEVQELRPAEETEVAAPWRRWDWPWPAPTAERQLADEADEPGHSGPQLETNTAAGLSAPEPRDPSPGTAGEPRAPEPAAPVPDSSEPATPEPATLEPASPGVEPTAGPSGPGPGSGPQGVEEESPLPRHDRPDSPGEPDEAPAPATPGSPSSEAPSQDSGHRPELWRGLPESALGRQEHCVLQLGVRLEEVPRADGGRELRVPADSEEPVWYFGPSLDVRVFPGASLVLEPDGSIRYHTGQVRFLQAHPERRF